MWQLLWCVLCVLVLEENLCQLSSLRCASAAAKPEQGQVGLNSSGHSSGPSPGLHPYLSYLSAKCKICVKLTSKFKDILRWRNNREMQKIQIPDTWVLSVLSCASENVSRKVCIPVLSVLVFAQIFHAEIISIKALEN